MRFHITTDYAIRILCYMYKRSEQCLTARWMSAELGMTYQYFMKVMNYLKQAKFVLTVQGCNGGFILAEHAKDLSLYDIIKVMEGDIIINRCLEEDQFCSRNGASQCPVHTVFEGLQGEIRASLEKIKIADLSF